MRLVPCPCPSGSLDPAPLTALCASEDVSAGAVAYEAFWGEDDGYYLRRTEGGVASWLAGRADDVAPGSAGARRSGSHATIAAAAEATAGHGVGRWRVMLVGQLGRQHGRGRARVPMHVCVRRARSAP